MRQLRCLRQRKRKCRDGCPNAEVRAPPGSFVLTGDREVTCDSGMVDRSVRDTRPDTQ
jgi:hypothetical protein